MVLAHLVVRDLDPGSGGGRGEGRRRFHRDHHRGSRSGADAGARSRCAAPTAAPSAWRSRSPPGSLGEKRWTFRVRSQPAITSIEIDPEKLFPDLNRENNVWRAIPTIVTSSHRLIVSSSHRLIVSSSHLNASQSSRLPFSLLPSSPHSRPSRPTTQKAALAVIERLFAALKADDTAAMRATMHPAGRIIQTGTREGAPFARVNTLNDFLSSIGSAKGRGLEERIYTPGRPHRRQPRHGVGVLRFPGRRPDQPLRRRCLPPGAHAPKAGGFSRSWTPSGARGAPTSPRPAQARPGQPGRLRRDPGDRCRASKVVLHPGSSAGPSPTTGPTTPASWTADWAAGCARKRNGPGMAR